MAGAPAPRTTEKAGGRALWWRIHAWAGLKLSIFLVFILATGTLATLAYEIDWLIRPALRIAPRPEAPPRWGAMLENARETLPRGGSIGQLALGEEPFMAASATRFDATERPSFVYLDPATGEVTGTGSWVTVHRILRQAHRHLMLPTRVGVPIVSSLALLLLASMVSGLVTYRRFWTGLLRRPRTRKGLPVLRDRRFMGDAHRLAGLWSLPLLLVMIATGLWYLAESLGAAAPPPAAQQRARTLLADAPAAPPVSGAMLDALVARARAAIPGLEVRAIRLPRRPGESLVVSGQASAWLVRDRANAVHFDPASGRLLAVSRGEELNLHQRISEAADPLHFGTFGGLAMKLLWFVLGLLLTGLAVSGVMITSLRLALAARDAPVRLSARAWIAMGAWRYAGAAAILVTLLAAPLALAGRF